jgi:hypothetical protein
VPLASQPIATHPEKPATDHPVLWRPLDADDTVADVLVAPRLTEENGYECVFVVRAATVDGAEAIALDALDRALRAALRELPKRRVDTYFNIHLRRPQPLHPHDDTS